MRQRRAPWTDEDWEIFRRFGVDCDGPHALDVYVIHDRSDAELMLEAQRIRSDTFPVDLPPIALILPGGRVVDLGGALEKWPTLRIFCMTPEDESIWRRVCCSGFHMRSLNRSGGQVCAESLALLADRRDAAIMLQLEKTRKFSRLFRPADYRFCMVHCLIRAELRDSGTFDWIPRDET